MPRKTWLAAPATAEARWLRVRPPSPSCRAARAAQAARAARPQFPRYDHACRARRSRRQGPLRAARRKRHRARAIAAAGRAAAPGGTHPRTVCPMNLGEILSGVALLQPLAPELAQAESPAIEFDSRRVSPQSLFFAFPGSKADGRQFAADAIARGAARRGQRIARAAGSSPAAGFRSRTAARRSPWPRAISIGGPTSASASPASPAPTARPPPPT